MPRGPAVVVGPVGRDLVLEIDRLPRGGRGTTVQVVLPDDVLAARIGEQARRRA